MKALILIDLQNDFMPWGSAGVEKSDEIIPLANQLMEKFDLIVASQDWHPADHKSFAANHPWRMPGQIVTVNDHLQLLWTMHCVRDSFGAELVDGLKAENISKIIRKGKNLEFDGYSAFLEKKDGKISVLSTFLKQNKVEEVYIMGLMTEFGVKHTAIDAVHFGFKTNVILDGCCWFDSNEENIISTIKELQKNGVQFLNSDDLK